MSEDAKEKRFAIRQVYIPTEDTSQIELRDTIQKISKLLSIDEVESTIIDLLDKGHFADEWNFYQKKLEYEIIDYETSKEENTMDRSTVYIPDKTILSEATESIIIHCDANYDDEDYEQPYTRTVVLIDVFYL